MNWRHTVAYLPDPNLYDDEARQRGEMLSALDALGVYGWELVAVTPIIVGDELKLTAFSKRPQEEY